MNLLWNAASKVFRDAGWIWGLGAFAIAGALIAGYRRWFDN